MERFVRKHALGNMCLGIILVWRCNHVLFPKTKLFFFLMKIEKYVSARKGFERVNNGEEV